MYANDIARTLYLIEITPVPENAPNYEEIAKLKKQSADIYLWEMDASRDQSIERNNILEYLSLQGLWEFS